MQRLLYLGCAVAVLAGRSTAAAQCYTFTHEHVDLLAIQWNAASNTLSLMASDDDHGGTLYASNQCVVICPESMKFTLPGGTPLGNEGNPLWILPQNPVPSKVQRYYQIQVRIRQWEHPYSAWVRWRRAWRSSPHSLPSNDPATLRQRLDGLLRGFIAAQRSLSRIHECPNATGTHPLTPLVLSPAASPG